VAESRRYGQIGRRRAHHRPPSFRVGRPQAVNDNATPPGLAAKRLLAAFLVALMALAALWAQAGL